MSRTISNVEVRVEVEVNPTEDENKVRVAVQRVLGDISLELIEENEHKRFVGKAKGLEALTKFYDLLRRERILDAARTVLLKGVQERKIIFYLNKQVAYVGHISFSQPYGESPLGPIRVEIECDEPQNLIDWLTPKTTSKMRSQPSGGK
ncbi:MAG: RNA-binding domain-containing protein [Candidatus Bathyarchaeia archaeon]